MLNFILKLLIVVGVALAIVLLGVLYPILFIFKIIGQWLQMPYLFLMLWAQQIQLSKSRS